MHEVSCRLFPAIAAAATEGGLAVDALLVGVEPGRDVLEDAGRRMPWNTWVTLCDRLALGLGDDAAVVRAGRHFLVPSITDSAARLAASLGSVRQLYRLGLSWVAPLMVQGPKFEVVESGPSVLDVSVTIPADMRGSRAWLLLCEGALVGGPGVFAQPDAGVARQELSGRTGRWRLTLTDEAVLGTGLKRFLSAFKSSAPLVDDLVEQQRQLSQAWADMRRSTRVFRETMDVMPAFVAIHVQGRLRFVNSALRKAVGPTTEPLNDAPLATLVHPDDTLSLGRLLDAGDASDVATLRLLRPGKPPLTVEARASSGLDYGQEKAGVLVATDIGEELEAARQLATSEATVRVLLQSMPDLVLRVAPDGTVLDVQAGGGFPEVDELRSLVGTGTAAWRRAFGHLEGVAALIDRGIAAVEKLFASGEDQRLTLEVPGAEGRPRTLVARLHLMQDGASALVLVHDDTERIDTERRLAVSERMSSLGTLAAGVAHEINSPLTYILTNLSVLKETVDEVMSGAQRERALRILSETEAGAENIRTTVARMRDLSRVESRKPVLVDLVHVVEGALHIASAEIRHRARLAKDLQAVRPVLGDPTDLGQVVVNLLANAAQAIPERSDTPNVIGVRLWGDGDEVFLEVSDTGIGVPPENLGRLFEPFFTTRAAQEGTGLGLAIAHRNISAAGGAISVTSEPGHGATFTVRLPAAGAVVSTAAARGPVVARRKASVLIVDDDELAGRAMARVLREHDVGVTTSGADAISRLSEGAVPDIVLCDIMMPGMSGIDVFEAVQHKRPEAASRFVFITGGVIGGKAEAFVNSGVHRIIRKPINAEALKELVAVATQSVDARAATAK